MVIASGPGLDPGERSNPTRLRVVLRPPKADRRIFSRYRKIPRFARDSFAGLPRRFAPRNDSPFVDYFVEGYWVGFRKAEVLPNLDSQCYNALKSIGSNPHGRQVREVRRDLERPSWQLWGD